MNIDALKDALRRANIDERFVSLDGSARDESLVIEHEPVMGWTVYFSERGQRTGRRTFRSEEQACQFVLEELSRDPTVKKAERRN